jgi:hypothetical protein
MILKKNIFCDAIERRALLEFQYEGRQRVVQPYCHGVSNRDSEVIRAVQVRGSSSSNKFGVGKLWDVAKVRGLRILDETFVPTDPNYNPNDTAMKHIHCRIERD